MPETGRDIIRRKAKATTRRHRLVRFYTFLLLSVLLFVALVLTSHYDRLIIKRLAITGGPAVADQTVSSLVKEILRGNHFYILSKRNIFLIPHQDIRRRILAAVPQIETVTLDRDWPSRTLIVAITERKPAALLCLIADQETCFFADQSGFIFLPAPLFSDNIYLKIYLAANNNPIGQRIINQEKFRLLVSLAEAMPKILAEHDLIDAESAGIKLNQAGDYELLITQPLPTEKLSWSLHFDLDEDIDHVLSNLEAAISSGDFKKEYATHNGRLEYIDLRFGNKVFYKFK